MKKQHQKIGIGTMLVDHAILFGRENSCQYAYVETMSFQAPAFYQKLGFKIEFERDGYFGGHSLCYLKKTL